MSSPLLITVVSCIFERRRRRKKIGYDHPATEVSNTRHMYVGTAASPGLVRHRVLAESLAGMTKRRLDL